MKFDSNILIGKISRGHLALVGLWTLISALLIPALSVGEFWWTDESRHAMGGVFILDLAKDMPLQNVMAYAFDYFAQYPALALNWYLPGFYAVEALLFGIFGISEEVARGTVMLFCLIGSGAWFFWLNRTWGTAISFFGTAIFLVMPEWNLWGRSVMLEIPVISMVMISIWAFQRYLDNPGIGNSLLAGVLVAFTLIVKQTSMFILPALLIYGVAIPGRAALWRREAIPAYLLIFLAVAMVALHALKFGGQAITSMIGEASVDVSLGASRLSLERWFQFPKILIETWGFPLLILSSIGAFVPRRPGEHGLSLIFAWIASWYVCMTLVVGSANAPRYTLYVFPALGLLAVRPLLMFSEVVVLRVGALFGLLLLLGMNMWRSMEQTVPSLVGYKVGAEYLYGAKTRGPVLFAGKNDGNFIFHLRRLDVDRRHVVLRADKILLSLAVQKYFGMKSYVKGPDDINVLLARYGVEYVVIEQPDILKLKEFAILGTLLQTAAFQEVFNSDVKGSGNEKAPSRLVVYRNLGYMPKVDQEIIIPLPHLNREIRFKPKFSS